MPDTLALVLSTIQLGGIAMLLYCGVAVFILFIVALSEGWIFPLPEHPWSASIDPRGFVQQATHERRIE